MRKIYLLIFIMPYISIFSQERGVGVENGVKDEKRAQRFLEEANNFVPIPELTSRVVDLTGTLNRDEKEVIERKLEGLEKSKGSQLVVLIVPTTGVETIEEYSMRVVESWKIGRKGIDDGVLLLIAKNDRR